MAEIDFEGVTPILRVANVEASTEHYTRVLGFKVNFQTPGFVSVSRGRCGIFLCEGDQGHAGAWVWIGVSDAEALCEQLRAKGAKVQIEDPDGNVLRMGSDPRENEPEGEWLDMHGRRWLNSKPVTP